MQLAAKQGSPRATRESFAHISHLSFQPSPSQNGIFHHTLQARHDRAWGIAWKRALTIELPCGNSQRTSNILMGISAPTKKVFTPPPPQFPNSPQTPSRPFGPDTPPLPSASDSTFPHLEEKKIKNIRNVHQDIQAFLFKFSPFRAWQMLQGLLGQCWGVGALEGNLSQHLRLGGGHYFRKLALLLLTRNNRTMATTFLTMNFAFSKIYCRGVAQEKTAFWDPLPPMPSPPSKTYVYLYCRLAASDRLQLPDGGSCG